MVAEECVEMNCVGQRIAAGLLSAGTMPKAMALVNLGRDFVPHGAVAELRKLCGLDEKSLVRRALEVCSRG